MLTRRRHSQSSPVGFNDCYGAGLSGPDWHSLQEVDNKAKVKAIYPITHPLQLITLNQTYAQGDPDGRYKAVIVTDEHDL